MKKLILACLILLSASSAYAAAAEQVPAQQIPGQIFVAQLNSWCTETIVRNTSVNLVPGPNVQTVYICVAVPTKGK